MLRATQCVALFIAIVASNVIANSSSAATLPTAGLTYDMNASQFITTNGSGVVQTWGNAAAGGTNIVSAVQGAPTLTTANFGFSSHPVVNFSVDPTTHVGSGILLNASASYANVGVYVVGNVTTTQTSEIFAADYVNNGGSKGWATGISDGAAGNVKWFGGPDGVPGDTLGNSTGQFLTPGKYYAIANTFVPGTKVSDVLDGTTTNTATDTRTTPILYAPSAPQELIGIGYLPQSNAQYLNGNIAEVLIYDYTGMTAAQIAASRASVESYLQATYFTPEPSSFVLLGLAGVLVAGGTLNRRRAKISG